MYRIINKNCVKCKYFTKRKENVLNCKIAKKVIIKDTGSNLICKNFKTKQRGGGNED